METEKTKCIGAVAGILMLFTVVCMAFGLFFTTVKAADRAAPGAVRLQVYDIVEEQFYELGVVYADEGFSDLWGMGFRKLKIPTLADLVPEEARCGKVLDVEGNWCYPVGNGSEGEEVRFFTITRDPEITYWVNYYDPDGNSNGDEKGREDTAEATMGSGSGRKWKQKIVFHSNDPNGPEDILTVTYNVNSYISSVDSIYNGVIHTFERCGFNLPRGYCLGKNYWNTKPDGTGRLHLENFFPFEYKKANTTYHLYAQYEAISPDKGSCYEIAYYETDDSLLGVKRIIKGETALIGTAEKGSTRLCGWNTERYSEEVEYEPGETIVPQENLQLYAVWNNKSIPGQYTVEWYDFAGNRIKPREERSGYVGEPVSVTEKDKTEEGYIWHPEHEQTVETAILEPDGKTVLRLYFDIEYVDRDITVEKVFRGIKSEEIPDDFQIQYQVTNAEVPDFPALSGILGTDSAAQGMYADGEGGDTSPSLTWTFTVQIPKPVRTDNGYSRESYIVCREENAYVPGYKQTESSFEGDMENYGKELHEDGTLSYEMLLHNKYEREITVTWLDGYIEGEDGRIKQISIKAGEDYSGEYPENPERIDYKFLEWGEPIIDEDGNITIIAQWEPEESEPEKSEPEESEPEETEPEESEPEETEPEESEPEETEPEESKPEETEPEESEPEETVPEESEPEETEPEESEESEPGETEPEASESEESEPEETEPEETEPEETEPEETEPKDEESEITVYSEEVLVLPEISAESAPVTGDFSSHKKNRNAQILSYFSIFFLLGAIFCSVKTVKKELASQRTDL